ncbi:glycerophosphodiester phosphodiesterase family protein [Aliidiomarina maris]|uniref:Glycerophosphodiester phosphodiesterase n=1 Tax=Aliidiomarina maris TaxID=531312 RepID=A0A327X2I1_9GAMM|nr:glycerophosphodiester phosphodiesterase family protein [Aliidiomarina maris]RAK00596.1 glycerophosphoryl diester phosphodiesterase [Aliidiomarina maris]RUO27392.1 glycerophosphodiester phosphodiesterase [Aliidiomarina maris]
MLAIKSVAEQVFTALAYHKRPMLAYHVFFSLLALLALSPLAGWALAGLIELSGYSMLGNEDLVRFLATPLGVAWMIAAASVFAFLLFFQAAGMLLIAARNQDDVFHTASNALWQVLKRFRQLMKLAAMQVVCHLLLAAPSVIALVWLFQWLLGGYDIYYVINAYPTELFYFLPMAAMLCIALLLGNGLLYASWSLALPAMLLDGYSPRLALTRSWQLIKGARFQVARIILFAALFTLLLPILFTVAFDALGSALMAWLPGPLILQVTLMGLLIVIYVLLAVVLAFFAVGVNSLLLLKLYLRCCGHQPTPLTELEPRTTARLAWAFEAALAVIAISQLVWIAHSFDERDTVSNIAHRGASWDAPENSLAAIAVAIEQGADYIELDVQQTADGTLVLLHDRDLLRVAGDRRAIWDIEYDELAQLDAGSWFSVEFADQRVPTLEQAIELIRGRANLYLEIKTAPQMPNLVADTVAELQRLNFVEQTVVAALSPRVLNQALALEPDLRASLLVHTAIGTMAGHPYDMLGLRDGIVTPSQVRAARRSDYALHVWTVNNRRDMHRFIDMGVDGIITDVPALLTEVMQERNELNRSERLLLRMRHWVW